MGWRCIPSPTHTSLDSRHLAYSWVSCGSPPAGVHTGSCGPLPPGAPKQFGGGTEEPGEGRALQALLLLRAGLVWV